MSEIFDIIGNAIEAKAWKKVVGWAEQEKITNGVYPSVEELFVYKRDMFWTFLLQALKELDGQKEMKK